MGCRSEWEGGLRLQEEMPLCWAYKLPGPCSRLPHRLHLPASELVARAQGIEKAVGQSPSRLAEGVLYPTPPGKHPLITTSSMKPSHPFQAPAMRHHLSQTPPPLQDSLRVDPRLTQAWYNVVTRAEFDVLNQLCQGRAGGLLKEEAEEGPRSWRLGVTVERLNGGTTVGAGVGPGAVLPLPVLLFGAPALLGLALALALALVGLVSWRRRRRRLGATSPETPDGDKDAPDPPENVIILAPGTLEATAPVWPLPREDPGTTSPGHSVPVPATELGSTELVTTKTAGPEQQ
ncbi:PREDICTED: tumor necrosis factor receptor superfamily member 13C [Galeopterus variegatus]|uniref:Tumor necrosis factor receptor superfamily member 13C n=1 Tax=Galeopterus variegatus TaxID=482537 RepID=A0ABM0QWI0_GALVR|nr:PREDICTED: tumor necrosis factor receptor superfamily member 13C [Galeopterus variegatus]